MKRLLNILGGIIVHAYTDLFKPLLGNGFVNTSQHPTIGAVFSIKGKDIPVTCHGGP
jgi:hypothetical protein